MQCQHRDEDQHRCDADATFVCEVPYVGDSLSCCRQHMLEAPPHADWIPLDAERAKQEEVAEQLLIEALQTIRNIRLKFNKK